MYKLINASKFSIIFLSALITGCSLQALHESAISHQLENKYHSIPFQVAVYSSYSLGVQDGVNPKTGESLVDINEHASNADDILINGIIAPNTSVWSGSNVGSVLQFDALINLLDTTGVFNHLTFFIDAEKFKSNAEAILEAQRLNEEAYTLLLKEYSFKYPISRDSLTFKGDDDGFQKYYRKLNSGDDASKYKNICYVDKNECKVNDDFFKPDLDFYGGEMSAYYSGDYVLPIKFLNNKKMWVVITFSASNVGMDTADIQKEYGFDPLEIYSAYAKLLPDNAYLFLVPRYSGLKIPIMLNKGKILSYYETGESKQSND